MASTISDALETAASTAGAAMHLHFNEPGRVYSTLKEDLTPVTKADKHIDERATKIYLNTFPDAGIIREEGKNINEYASLRFTIDGIDGTGEYARGGTAATFATACEKDGVVQESAIFAPLLPKKLFFVAKYGQGASLNERSIKVSPLADLSQRPRVEIATAPGTPVKNIFLIAHDLQEMGFQVGEVRSISYSNAMVAAGVIAGVIFPWSTLWDIMPGDLMVREAGGTVTDLHGGSIDYRGRQIDGMISSNGHFHQVLVDTVSNHY